MQDEKGSSADPLAAVEKWKGQIEKVSNYIILLWTPVGVGSFFSSGCLFQVQDLPRTFPGHPALDDDGRNALRRLLTLCWILSGMYILSLVTCLQNDHLPVIYCLEIKKKNMCRL